MKRTRVTVRWVKKDAVWVIYGVNAVVRWTPWFFRKSDAVSEAREQARLLQPSQLVIFKKNGQIQEERTYPRSSDPRRYRG